MNDGLVISGQAEDHGVTQFANEACESVETIAVYETSKYLRHDTSIQDLKTYFERPRLIVVNNAATGNSYFNQGTLEVNYTNLTTWFPQWSQRLSGVYGIKFSITFTVQFAATPFHQGLIVSAFQYGSVGLGTSSKYRRCSNTMTITNLPHVRLDISEGTMCELKVPFLYANEFYPVTGSDLMSGIYGTWGLAQVLGIQTVTGLAAPTYKIYVNLSDIELYGADNNSVTTITLQSGMVQEAREMGIVSGTLSQASKVSSFLGKHIPSLAAIAGPTAWALDIASGVAKYFGFSRPILTAPPMRVYRSATAQELNVDLPAASVVLGPMSSNTLAHSTALGLQPVDEMAIKFITSQYSQVLVGRVTTSDSHGTVVYAAPVGPSVMWFRAPSTAPYCNKSPPVKSTDLISQSGNSIMHSSLMHISTYFRLWRGGIRFRFTFAKTKFHAGRYMVSFNPKTTNNFAYGLTTTVDGPETVTTIVQPYGYSQIMDMKDSNVFEFLVPYMNEQPYLSYYSFMGSISIVCIDPLIAPSTVATSIPFLVEVAGADDYELADFAGTSHIPFANGTIYLQSGQISVKNKPLLSSATSTPCEDAIGECLTSVKQLIQFPSYIYADVPANTAGTTIIPPWYWNSANNTMGAAPAIPIAVGQNYSGSGISCATLATMYGFARGSTDFHAYLYGTTEQTWHTIYQNPSLGSLTNANTTASGFNNTLGTPRIINNGALPMHARFPAFQALVRVPLVLAGTTGQSFTRAPASAFSAVPFPALGHFNFHEVNNSSSNIVRTILGYAAGDDAMLSCFIGPEPVVIPNGASVLSMFPNGPV